MREIKVIYPAQCSCGHLFLERYQFTKPNEQGEIGFCWCGFCRTRLMVKPYADFKGGLNAQRDKDGE